MSTWANSTTRTPVSGPVASTGSWYADAMEATIDSAGRVVVPKALREVLGLAPGTVLDVSAYGSGVMLVQHGPTARLVEEDGRLVAHGDRSVTDEDVFALIDAGRR
jgi:AbrB family looped-hinge helix DNA binding protein